MFSWLIRTAQSSIGKKTIMSLSGLALIGFLIAHLLGNLTFYVGSDGEAFNHYAATLGSNPLLPVAEAGLVVLFLVHIVMALRVTYQNRKSREQGYFVKASHGGRTIGSRNMIWTGILVLGFLILHLYHFRLQDPEPEEMYGLVRHELSQPLGAGAYVLGIIALGIHLSHGFKSALQTLGINHPKYTPIFEKLGLLLAILLGAGFLSFPLIIFLGGQA